MSRKIILYTASSLDGFIAGPGGSLDWLENTGEKKDEAQDYGYQDFLDTIDTTLMGYNTYRAVLGFDIPFPYPDKTNFVFSRDHRHEDKNPVHFVREDPAAFTARLKEQPGKDIWLIGGGQISALMLNADLIDEIILSLIPAALGKGIPLFSPEAEYRRFRLHSVKDYGQVVQLRLARHSQPR